MQASVNGAQPLTHNHYKIGLVKNLVRECLQLMNIDCGMEIASFADVPAGTGMGSSSAFTVCLLHALYALSGRNPSAAELAKTSCHIEIDRAREPIGKQDQYATAFGGLNCIRFHPDESVEVSPIACSNETRQALQNRLREDSLVLH